MIGLADIIVIIGSIGSGIGSACIIAYVIHSRNVALLEQQKKVDSARLIKELYKPWKGNEQFKQFLIDLNNDMKLEKYSDDYIHQILNTLEQIAAFWYDGTINEFHVRVLFSSDLKSLALNERITNYISNIQQKTPTLYKYLSRLLEKSNTWKD